MNTKFPLRSIALVIVLFTCSILGIACSAPSPTSTPTLSLTAAGALPDYWPTEDWRSSSPEAQGMDGRRLESMLVDVKQRQLDLHSLIVIRNGYIVSETYFPPYNQGRKHDLFSVTKSFVATLVGIAIDKGYIAGVTVPVKDLITSASFQNQDARKQAMTLENLLTMTSGLEWEEGDTAYRAMYASTDWVEYVMGKPMVAQPGSQFNYCSGCSHILSAILQSRTGMNARTFADKQLFAPLGISGKDWSTDAKGISIGGWGLLITPREMAKLGYLYLHNGAWEGKQIVSSQWVKTAVQEHIGTDSDLGYGYQWWTYPSLSAYAALGRGGQTIFVIPDLNLIVVTTANIDTHDEIYRLIEEYIVPAVRKS